jgi:nucleoside-diphosphate-sugar epimerase
LAFSRRDPIFHNPHPRATEHRSFEYDPQTMKFPAETVDRLRRHYEGRSVCVTGGAGFIGGHLVDALMSLGADIVVIDDLSSSTLDHLAGVIELEPERIRFVHGSILDDAALADAVEGAQTIFHLAAIGSVPRSIVEPQRSWSVNATGTVRVMETARAEWCKDGKPSEPTNRNRVVFAASSSAYGDDPVLPKVETQYPRPLSPYAASKLAAEHILASWSTSYGISTASTRFFNVFGPRQPADSAYAAVIPAFTRRLLLGEAPVIFGDGKQSRDFTSVTNAVLAQLLAGACERHLKGEVFNVGTGNRIDLLELATLMAELCGVPHLRPEFRPARVGDVPHSLADFSRASEILGYQPVESLRDGLDETLAWARREMAGTGNA